MLYAEHRDVSRETLSKDDTKVAPTILHQRFCIIGRGKGDFDYINI